MGAIDTKQRILEASIDLFSKNGFTETSVKAIATEAGIKTSTIYFYYPSKTHILDEIMDIYKDQTKTSVPSLPEIDGMIAQKSSASEIIHSLFYRWQPENAEMYVKIVKIILQEQYRNEQVHEFVQSYLINYVDEYLRKVLQKLVDAELIAPVNCRYIAKIMNSANLAAIMDYAHNDPAEDRVRPHWRSQVLEFLIGRLLEPEGHPSV